MGHIGFHGINIDGGYPGPETGDYSYGHLITNNVIHDIGELVGHGTGIQALQLHDSKFSQLEIYNSPRRAIFLEGAWASRTEQDGEFNRYRDSHTYENCFEYLFMHDLQQDGGDDGAFFCSTLYGSWGDTTGSRPNYINQVYMDNIGSPSSNKDFKPNGINFDMGCAGIEVSNFKAVNPQHYNIRYDGGDGIKFENVNMAYYAPQANSNYKNFDDSKMEYDRIGVDASFPYKDAVNTVIGKTDKSDEEYENLYYREEFDKGLGDWWSLAGTPETTPVYFSDNDDFIGNSFMADAFYNSSTEGCRIGKPFGSELNKIVEIDFFDHMCDGMENGYCGMALQYKLNSFARVDNGISQRAIGVNHAISDRYYSYKIGSITKISSIKREYGWHTFQWDYTDGSTVKMYIDDELIATVPASSFSYIEMGDYGAGGFNAYDNVVIYGGEPADPPMPLPEEPEKEEPETETKKLPGRIEMEDADQRPSSTQLVDGANGGQAVGYISAGDVFKFNVVAEEEFDLPLTILQAGTRVNTVEVTIDGGDPVSLTLPNTGDWTIFKEYITAETFHMTAGEHEICFKTVTNYLNLDSFGFMPVPEEVKAESIVPSVTGNLILGVGNTVKVPYQVLPANADDKTVTWTTDDAEGSVLTVTADGTITAVGVGVKNVTVSLVSDPSISATFAVEVQDAEASLISTTAKGCVPSANVDPDNGSYTPDKLMDGKFTNPCWAAKSVLSGGREDPSAYYTWDTPQTVKAIWIYDITEGGNYVEQMEIIIRDENNEVLQTIPLANGVPDGGMEKVVLEEALENVKQIEFHILKGTAPYKNYGFSEIKVFGEDPGVIPVNSISFGSSGVTLFEGETFTLNPPVAVPSTATNQKVDITVAEGEDVISIRANSTDGIIRNYTITALTAGRAVIRATADNGVTADFVVTVATKEQLENKIIEAENLYAMFPGDTDAHKAFRKVIDEALDVYKNSQDVADFKTALEKLDAAMEAFRAAATPSETAQQIADGLTLENPAKGATTLTKPEVPLGFSVSILETDPQNVVGKYWTINVPDEDTQVTVTLLVTRTDDNTTATKDITITVPGYSAQEVLDTVTISQPEKKAEKVTLPKMPYGFEFAVVKSTDDLIAADGTITWPLEDTEVTVTVRVTKTANQTYAEKEITLNLTGYGKPYGVPIEANDIDQLNGTYICIKDNEVFNYNPGNWIRYDYVDFGEEDRVSSVFIETAVHPGWAGKTIEILLDDLNSEPVGSIVVQAFGDDWGIYGTQEAVLNTALSGYHTVYLRAVAGGNNPSEGAAGIRTVTVNRPSSMHDIVIDGNMANGTVEADKTEAMPGETVTLTVIPDTGWELSENGLKVNDGAVELAEENGVYSFVMPEEDVTITALFQKAELVERWNITLQDDLNVNFHLNLNAEDQVKVTVGTEETVYDASALNQTADGKYIVTVEMAAAQMMDEIAIQVLGSNADSAIYTIRQYADTVLADDTKSDYHALVKEMLNYGAMAQVYFDHNAENLANTGIEGFGTAEVTEAAYEKTIYEGAVDGISLYSASLVYGSKVAVRLYFQVLSGSIEDYTFSNGTDNLTAVAKGDYYYIEFANITPDKWNEVVNLYVIKGEQSIHVQYSPLSYMVRMSGKATSSDALKNLLKAMYNYHLAASSLTSGS